jgi:hypothetical protein
MSATGAWHRRMKKNIGLLILAAASGSAAGAIDEAELDTNRFVRVGEARTMRLPLDGWTVKVPEAEAGTEIVPGIAVESSTVMLGGSESPALELRLTRGAFPNGHQPYVETAAAFDGAQERVGGG